MTSQPEMERSARHQHILDYDKSRRKRADRLFHWSLDMPPGEDDVDVRVNKGMGWKELAVIAGSILGGAWMLSGPAAITQLPIPSIQSPATQQPGPVDSEYEVRFYDKDGNPIDVPHISTKAQ